MSLLKPDSNEYDRAIMLKGFAILERVSWHRYFNPTPEQLAKDFETLKELMEIVEPIGCKVIGFSIYFETIMTLMFNYKSRNDLVNCRLQAKRLDEAYSKYVAANTEMALHRSTLLGGDDFHKRDFDMIEYQIGFLTWQAYEANPELAEPKHAAKAIKWLLYVARKNFNTSMPEILSMFQPVNNILNYFLKRREFKQLDLILAVLMSFLVKFRRSLAATFRPQLDNGQGLIARVYAKWGKEILEASVAKILGKDYQPINNGTFWAINESDDIDYKVYSGQFPLEPVEGKEELMQVVKRTKAWNKRADDLSFFSSTDGINIALAVGLSELTIKTLFPLKKSSNDKTVATEKPDD